MKFLKVIMALVVLLGLQNSLIFGAEMPEIEQMPEMGMTEKKIAAKNAAIKVLNAYINIPSATRVQRNIELAERALQIITSYEMLGGDLTENEEKLVSRVVGALPIDKARLTGTRAGYVRTIPTRAVGKRAAGKKAAGKAITVGKSGAARTVGRTQPTIKRTLTRTAARPTRLGAARPAYKPGKAAKRPTTIRKITPRVMPSRAGVAAPALVPFTVPTPTISDLQEQLTLWFGTVNLSSFFNQDGSINNDTLMQAYNSIKPYIQILGQSPDNVSKLIGHIIVNNANSGLTFDQERMLMDASFRLLKQIDLTSAGRIAMPGREIEAIPQLMPASLMEVTEVTPQLTPAEKSTITGSLMEAAPTLVPIEMFTSEEGLAPATLQPLNPEIRGEEIARLIPTIKMEEITLSSLQKQELTKLLKQTFQESDLAFLFSGTNINEDTITNIMKPIRSLQLQSGVSNQDLLHGINLLITSNKVSNISDTQKVKLMQYIGSMMSLLE